jgi:hypothetical protein
MKKIVNIINVVLQGLTILIALGAIFSSYFDSKSNFSGDDFGDRVIIILFVTGIFLCPYQLLHAFVLSVLKVVQKKFDRLFGAYWIICLAYCVFLVVVLTMKCFSDDMIMISLLLGIIPVVYYFIISIIDMIKSLKT